MANVNTSSVREEIARVEQEISQINDEGKVSDESRMLFKTLLMIVTMLVVIFTERSTKKTSKSSSIPPSQTTEDPSSTTPSSKKKGLAQNDESFDNIRSAETETVASVNRCSACNENLSQISVTDYERRTRNDIVFGKTCGSHLLRELEFIIDSNGYAWVRSIKRLLKETCAKVSARKRKKLTEKEYSNLQKRYRNILTRGISELPPRPERPSGKRGRLAQSDAQNLWDRMYEHEYAILLLPAMPRYRL